MPQIPALSPEQLAEFEREGVLRVDGLVSPAWFRPARDAVLRQLEKIGLYEDGAWRWSGQPEPTSLKVARDIGHRHPEIEALLEDPGVMAAVNALLGGRPYDRSVHRRPQVLCTLPSIDRWTLPPGWGWHTDSPRLANGARPGVQIFTFLEPVERHGGGTLVVAGSHRLLADAGALRPKDVNGRLRAKPFFKALYAGPTTSDLPTGLVDDVPVRVVELTGRPGDAWLVDLRALHTAAPNAADRPRIMVTYRFLPADLMPLISAAYGWT